jgi:hypothetical protein
LSVGAGEVTRVSGALLAARIGTQAADVRSAGIWPIFST